MNRTKDITGSEVIDISSADLANSNTVQIGHANHNSECSSPSVCQITTVSVRDFKQCRQPSVSARISCFEPIMTESSTGCQQENKRARLSSVGSAVTDTAETKSNNMSHSVTASFAKSCLEDDDGWFVEAPQHAKQYQRSSSAGHEDLLALLNIPATSAKHIPRVSERKRMFEMETAKVNSSESTSLVACSLPTFECGSQRLSNMDKENSLCGHESNCQGHVNSRRSLFEGSVRSDTLSGDGDCHSLKYPVNRIKTKNRCTGGIS